MKVSWNLSGKEESGEDGGVTKGGVVGLFVVPAIVLATEELVLKGVSIGAMDTSSWFELVEAMCCVGIGSQEFGEIQFVSDGGVMEDIGSCSFCRTLIPQTRVGVCSC